MAGYLPRGIDKFSYWMNNFSAQIAIHGPAVGASSAEIADFVADAPRYTGELAGVIAARNAYRAAVALRDNDRMNTIEPRLRLFVQRIQNDPGMTDAIRRELGITVADDTLTPLSEVSIEEAGHPLLVADVSQSKRVTLKFGKNPLNQRQNGLPAGVRCVRLWYFVGSGPPHNEDDWVFLNEDSRSPYTHVAMNPEPMTITFRAAYVDRHNRVGAFSDTVTVTINP